MNRMNRRLTIDYQTTYITYHTLYDNTIIAANKIKKLNLQTLRY